MPREGQRRSARFSIRSTRRGDGTIIDFPMNPKALRKKIRKLETRLQEGPQKLAKLKRKLEAVTKAKARKAKRKAAVRTAAVRRSMETLIPIRKGRSTAQPPVKAASVQKRSSARKTKRKLNLSPERRAQLAAAMKARWAAKRAAAEANSQSTSSNGDSASLKASQSPFH